MIYELTYKGYALGMFRSVEEARKRASYLPKGRYTVRELEGEEPFLLFDPDRHLFEEFDNKAEDTPKHITSEDIDRIAARIKERADDPETCESFECIDCGLIVFVELDPTTAGNIKPRPHICSVWDAIGKECRTLRDALQLLVG